MWNIFLGKAYIKCVGKLVPDPFLKYRNWTYIWINSLKFYTACFYYIFKWMSFETYWHYGADHLALPHIKLFQKSYGTSLPASFSAWFLKKNVCDVIFYQLIKFHSLTVFISWDIRMCIVIIFYPDCDVINFETDLRFLIKPLTENVWTKT